MFFIVNYKGYYRICHKNCEKRRKNGQKGKKALSKSQVPLQELEDGLQSCNYHLVALISNCCNKLNLLYSYYLKYPLFSYTIKPICICRFNFQTSVFVALNPNLPCLSCFLLLLKLSPLFLPIASLFGFADCGSFY